MRYAYTARFFRSLKKCDTAIQDDAVYAVRMFEAGNNSEMLKLHKLHGKFKEWHAFSANYKYRIIVKIEKDAIYYLDIGTHDIYK
ncbi:MAG: hypothetical protein Q7S19_03585 [bacterium]|nr:hypothetical protein [bacterium]